MLDRPEHFFKPIDYHRLANTELKWLPMDTEELFQKNLHENYDLMQQLGWIDHPNFTYKFNSHGFRSDEFTDEPSAIFLGCSFTQGIGLPWRDTWAYQVAAAHKLKCYNLGQGGGANDTAFRLGYYWIQKLKPKFVVYMTVDSSRFEIMNHLRHSLILKANTMDNFKDFNTFYNTWIASEINTDLNKLKNTHAIQNICQNNNVKSVVVDIDIFNHSTSGYANNARDLAHPGIANNKLAAERILKLLN